LWLGCRNGIYRLSADALEGGVDAPRAVQVLRDSKDFDLQQLVSSKRRLFALTTEGEAIEMDSLLVKKRCFFCSGEVRCFSLEDLSEAAQDSQAGRPSALAATSGLIWIRKPRRGGASSAAAYARPSQPICLHGLQLFYSAPGSTRVERAGAADL